MPRRGGHHHHHHGGGTNDLVTLTADRILREDFDRGVKTIHSLTGLLAERLRSNGGDLTQALESDQEFLREQKDRLIALAETNAQQMQTIHSFKDALNHVRDQCINDNSNEDKDYGRLLQEILDKNQGTNKRKQGSSSYREFVRQIRTKLGDGEKDDELEMVMPSSSEENKLKCPITGTFFEDPVMNSICKHTYERNGLVHHRRTGKTSCPIAGCPNANLNEIEDDIEMKLKVQQYKKRLQRLQLTKKEEEDDDQNNLVDEDNEINDTSNGMTIIH